MSPAAIALALQLLQLAIQEEPAIAADLKVLFSKGAPTDADFAAFLASIAAESYGEFVPASDLPASETAVNPNQG